MVFRMELTYQEVAVLLDTKYIDAKTIGYIFPPGLYEIFDIKSMLKSLLPDEAEVNITIADIRQRSSLTTNKKQLGLLRSLFSYNIRTYSISFRTIR